MSLNAEPIKQENDLLRLIDEGIAALQENDEFLLTVEAIADSQKRVNGNENA